MLGMINIGEMIGKSMGNKEKKKKMTGKRISRNFN
jgi:ATP-dependent HslUV protease ATP-binding subunit HslU